MTDHDSSSAEEDEFRLKVYAELKHRLFSNGVPIASMGLLFLSFGLYTAWRMQDRGVALAVSATALVSACHLLVVLVYGRRTRPRRYEEIRAWEVGYGLVGFLSAALVGLSAARVFLSDDLGSGMMMTALVFGYAAGTISRSAARPLLTGPRIGILVACPIVALESRLDVLSGAHGLLIFLFTITALQSMSSLHRQAVSEIELWLKQSETARRDPLTRLANRLAFDEFLAARLVTGAAEGSMTAVHCLDLDRFKSVNDNFGHPVGDALLQAVAERLRVVAGPDDLVARLGGDEFVLVQLRPGNVAEAERLAARIVEALRAPYRLGGTDIVSGCSVGVAVAQAASRDPASLSAEADQALYLSKSKGRDTYTIGGATGAERAALPDLDVAS